MQAKQRTKGVALGGDTRRRDTEAKYARVLKCWLNRTRRLARNISHPPTQIREKIMERTNVFFLTLLVLPMFHDVYMVLKNCVRFGYF